MNYVHLENNLETKGKKMSETVYQAGIGVFWEGEDYNEKMLSYLEKSLGQEASDKFVINLVDEAGTNNKKIDFFEFSGYRCHKCQDGFMLVKLWQNDQEGLDCFISVDDLLNQIVTLVKPLEKHAPEFNMPRDLSKNTYVFAYDWYTGVDNPLTIKKVKRT